MSLEAAVKAAAALLNEAERPVLVAGSKLRISKSCEAFVHLANACGYAITAMPAAKGLVPENHPQFMGTYWGRSNSSSLCAETFESADACLYAGPVFDDLSTNGYSIHLDKETSIIVQPQRVEIGNKISVEGVLMEDFLRALGGQLKHNARSFEDYRMMCVRTGLESAEVRGRPKEALKADVLFKHVQKMVSSDSVVVVEAGDAWFYTQKLKLPQGCGYEIQMLYASIGWSVGATLGYAQAAPHRRVIACIGDGSFQMAAQEVSTMLQCGQRSIIFLTNNDGYAIEAKIHDGPYNVIKKWDYTAVVNAIHNGHGNFWAAQVRCEEELVAAVDMAMGEKKDHLCLIEVMLHKHDTSKELLHWAAKFVDPNASPP